MIGADDTVDVGVIGDLGGCHHPVEEFHHLHGHQSVCEEEQEPCDDEADALEEEDGLVAHVVCNQEDWEKECKVGVCPNWENLVGNLEENKRGSIFLKIHLKCWFRSFLIVLKDHSCGDRQH